MEFFLALCHGLAMFFFPAVTLTVAILLLRLSKRKIFKLFYFLSFMYFYFSANGLIPGFFISRLEANIKAVDESVLCDHQAMIVLGGGNTTFPGMIKLNNTSEARLVEAFRLYQKALKVCQVHYKIFLSGADVSGVGRSEAKLLEDMLVNFGVNKEDIRIDEQSMNTFENAKFIKTLIKDEPYDKYLLVTSAVHMRRAQKKFAHFNINTTAAAADYSYPIKGWLPRGYNLVLQDKVMHEYLGLVKYWLYNKLELQETKIKRKSSKRYQAPPAHRPQN